MFFGKISFSYKSNREKLIMQVDDEYLKICFLDVFGVNDLWDSAFWTGLLRSPIFWHANDMPMYMPNFS